MKLTKKRFSCWEDKDDKDYQKDLDDELIISINPDERSRDIADYILECQKRSEWLKIIEGLIDEEIVDDHSLGVIFQNIKFNKEKAKDYDKMERIVFDLTKRLKEYENGKRV